MGNSYPILEKEAIDYLCGLIRNITNITDSLDDLHVRTDGTFSSHKIDTLLQIILNEANEYTDQITSALVRITAEEMTEEPTLDNTTDKINTLIIYSPTGDTNYNQYLRLENKLIDFGPAEIDMSNVYTKEQANAKFALVTDIEGIIDAIGSENMGTVATTLKGAIKEIKDEIDNVNFDDLVEKSSIVTTLDDTVTDEQIPSVKLVKEKLDEVFQSSNDAQNEYETAIIGKGGTVSKVGSVATKSEIISGIESISKGDIEVIHDVMTNLGYTATNLTNTDTEKTAHILSKWFKLKTATNNVNTILNASNTSSTFTNWMIDSEITDFGNYINPNYTTTQLTLSQDTTTDMFISENLTVHELYTINEGEVN